MVDAFVGKFKLDTSENFDEFMKALGKLKFLYARCTYNMYK